MKPFEDDIKTVLEGLISDAKSKHFDMMPYKPILVALEEILEKYNGYFLKEKLIFEVEKIRSDKFFKKPTSININAPVKFSEDIMKQVNLLIWDKRILRRFSLYAFTKAWIEVINDRREKYEQSNKIYVTFLFVLSLYEITKTGIHHFSSITINSKDQSKAKSTSIKNIEPMLDAFHKPISKLKNSIENLKDKLDWSEKKTIQFYDYILNLNISVIEKDIFYGILDDFEITKLNGGVQSKRYKTLLLSNLFKHTHPHLYHEQEVSKTNRTRDDLNYEGLLKLINTPGSNLFQ